ncbi:hypothetical protein ACQ4PT_035887 [Festuca glaucescens]
MGAACDNAVEQLARLLDQVEEPLKKTFQNVHQGYSTETLVRFLKAREWHVTNAHKMGVPVFAFGVGQSTYDKASVHYYVQSHIQINEYRDRIILPMASKKFRRPITTCIKVLDMTGLKLSALSLLKILTPIYVVDDLNYPEKAESYYIVNAPYIFSACWKVVKPLLQERTRKKVHVLHGSGKDELLKIMDHSSIPHFCRREGSSKSSLSSVNDCFSLDHLFHQELYRYIEQQALNQELVKQCSLHVDIPDQDPEDAKIVDRG